MGQWNWCMPQKTVLGEVLTTTLHLKKWVCSSLNVVWSISHMHWNQNSSLMYSKNNEIWAFEWWKLYLNVQIPLTKQTRIKTISQLIIMSSVATAQCFSSRALDVPAGWHHHSATEAIRWLVGWTGRTRWARGAILHIAGRCTAPRWAWIMNFGLLTVQVRGFGCWSWTLALKNWICCIHTESKEDELLCWSAFQEWKLT